MRSGAITSKARAKVLKEIIHLTNIEMKTYRSNHDAIEFENLMACALDNERDNTKFTNLFAFMVNNYPDAVEEWRIKHNWVGCTFGHIQQTLLDIGVLKR